MHYYALFQVSAFENWEYYSNLATGMINKIVIGNNVRRIWLYVPSVDLYYHFIPATSR